MERLPLVSCQPDRNIRLIVKDVHGGGEGSDPDFVACKNVRRGSVSRSRFSQVNEFNQIDESFS